MIEVMVSTRKKKMNTIDPYNFRQFYASSNAGEFPLPTNAISPLLFAGGQNNPFFDKLCEMMGRQTLIHRLVCYDGENFISANEVIEFIRRITANPESSLVSIDIGVDENMSVFGGREKNLSVSEAITNVLTENNTACEVYLQYIDGIDFVTGLSREAIESAARKMMDYDRRRNNPNSFKRLAIPKAFQTTNHVSARVFEDPNGDISYNMLEWALMRNHKFLFAEILRRFTTSSNTLLLMTTSWGYNLYNIPDKHMGAFYLNVIKNIISNMEGE